MQQLLHDDEGGGGMSGYQQGGITREAHEGMFALRADEALRRFDRLGGHRQGGECPCDHAPNPDGTEFLPDAIGGATVQLLNMLQGFFRPGSGFLWPNGANKER